MTATSRPSSSTSVTPCMVPKWRRYVASQPSLCDGWGVLVEAVGSFSCTSCDGMRSASESATLVRPVMQHRDALKKMVRIPVLSHLWDAVVARRQDASTRGSSSPVSLDEPQSSLHVEQQQQQQAPDLQSARHAESKDCFGCLMLPLVVYSGAAFYLQWKAKYVGRLPAFLGTSVLLLLAAHHFQTQITDKYVIDENHRLVKKEPSNHEPHRGP